MAPKGIYSQRCRKDGISLLVWEKRWESTLYFLSEIGVEIPLLITDVYREYSVDKCQTHWAVRRYWPLVDYHTDMKKRKKRMKEGWNNSSNIRTIILGDGWLTEGHRIEEGDIEQCLESSSLDFFGYSAPVQLHIYLNSCYFLLKDSQILRIDIRQNL